MDELPILGDEVTQLQYDGSRVFSWLADMSGLSVDLVSREKRGGCYVPAEPMVRMHGRESRHRNHRHAQWPEKKEKRKISYYHRVQVHACVEGGCFLYSANKVCDFVVNSGQQQTPPTAEPMNASVSECVLAKMEPMNFVFIWLSFDKRFHKIFERG